MEVCSHNQNDPYTLLIKINGTKCNLHCTYCSEIKKTVESSMGREECRNIILNAPEGSALILHGGEPTLDIELLNEAFMSYRKRSDKQYKLGIQTNGYISNAIQDLIINNADILNIGISMDGPGQLDAYRISDNGSYTCSKVDMTLRNLEAAKIPIKIISTINAVNISHYKDIIEYFTSYENITMIRINPCFDVINNDIAYYAVSPEEFLEFLKKSTDYWIRNKLYQRIRLDPIQAEVEAQINHQTWHRNCTRFVSVYPGGFYTICDAWGMKGFNTLKIEKAYTNAKEFENSLMSTDICTCCKRRNVCSGGCPAIINRFINNSSLLNEYCNYRIGFKKYISSMIKNMTISKD